MFNGDADGIIATHQLRLARYAEKSCADDASPPPILITGVKRDIQLLDRLLSEYADADWPTVQIFVCDISLDSNASALYRLLDLGATVHYFDHHRATRYVPHARLHAHIDTAAATCTSLIVDATLQHQFHAWAIAAAFGDGLLPTPRQTIAPTALNTLNRIGKMLNYNAYGDSVEDLYFAPETVLAAIQDFDDPLAFHNASSMISRLESGFNDDLALLTRVSATEISANCQLWTLPDAPASRRANGSFANQVSSAAPQQAHVILTPIARAAHEADAPEAQFSASFSASIRAPKVLAAADALGADAVAAQFSTGGGRKASAGINVLPQSSVSALCASMRATFG